MGAHRIDEDLRGRLAANCAGAYRTWVDRLGKRTQLWDELSCADLELAVALPVNGATLLSNPRNGDHDLLERAAAFFADRRGGPYEVWSLWPLPGLSEPGHEGEQVPCMLREPGGSRPQAPAELEIVEVNDASAARQAEWLIDEVFEARTVPGSLLTLGCLDDRFRVWLGRVDGRPVTTATAFIDDGFVGIFAVATAAHARGRGYAEAVTWSATMCRPELPATLQASQEGRPIYERMGYRTVAEFTVWELDR